MPLLDSDTLTTTGAEDVIQNISALGAAFAAQFDLSQMTAGDTVIIRWKPEFVETSVQVQSQSWQIVHGTTTDPDWVGAFGSEAEAFDTGVIWTPSNGQLTLEQTVGSPIDIPWQIWQL